MTKSNKVVATFALIGIILLGVGVYLSKQKSFENRDALHDSTDQSENLNGAHSPEVTVTPVNEPSASSESMEANPLTLYFVATEDSGVSGTKIGCGDSLVPVTTESIIYKSKLEASLQKLLSNHEQRYGQSGLYNALYQSDLVLESFSKNSETLEVYLSGAIKAGGVCDAPRIKAQLEQTTRTATGVESIKIYVNKEDLDKVLSLQ